jgi:hypothetical protein
MNFWEFPKKIFILGTYVTKEFIIYNNYINKKEFFRNRVFDEAL